jgi:hypothetical protein
MELSQKPEYSTQYPLTACILTLGVGPPTRRLLEQQSEELPLRVPQQQRARQRQQQQRFSGCVFGPQHSSIALVAGQNWQV